MLGAASYERYRYSNLLPQNDVGDISVGFSGALSAALLVVSARVRFIATRSLRVFAWYRIALALVIAASLALAAS